jgi:hypothetical protein
MIGCDRLCAATCAGENHETLANDIRACEELGWYLKVTLEDYLQE